MKDKIKQLLLLGLSLVIYLVLTQPLTEIFASDLFSVADTEGVMLDATEFMPENILAQRGQASAMVQPRADPVFPPGTNIVVEEAGPNESIPSWGYKLVQTLLGEGVDIVESSVIVSVGHIDGLGRFKNGTHATEIEEGIILSTGAVRTIPGPNKNSNTSRTLGGPSGDADLQTLITADTVRERTIIEFDFIPRGRKLVFDYVFASEEYIEFVGQRFNDVFGFFINEVGKPKTNIAVLPDMKTPVAINNINHLTNSQYFRNNDRFNSPFPGPGEAHINIEFDGLTTLLQAEAEVTPGVRYRIKLAIGDVGDNAFDSAVFIRANSFSSKYSVSYNAGGASGTVPQGENVELGDTHTILPPTNLSYPGYKFMGWKATVKGVELEGDLYQPGDIFQVDDVTELTAQWEEIRYEVTYDLNQGVGVVPAKADYGENALVTVAGDGTFNRPDYDFVGWLSSVDGKIYQPNSQFNITADTTLSAQWLGTPVISADFKIVPNKIKQTEGTTLTSTFENTGKLPTAWTNVVYETTPFPVGVVPDLATLKVNDVPATNLATFNSTTRVLRVEFPAINQKTTLTYEAKADANAPVGINKMSYTVSGKEGSPKTSNEETLEITRNIVTMTIQYRLQDGVTPVKNIQTGEPTPDKVVGELKVGSVFDVEMYKEEIPGFIYTSVINPANTTVPPEDFTVVFQYKGGLSLLEVTSAIDFGANPLITFGQKDLRPLESVTVKIMDTRESEIDWQLSLSIGETFKNSLNAEFLGEIRFKDKTGVDDAVTEIPRPIQIREENVLGESSVTWDKETEGLYLRQFPGNKNDTYTGVLLWTLTDGL